MNQSVTSSSSGGAVIHLLRERKREHIDVALFSRVDFGAHHPASIALLMEESRKRRLLRQRMINHLNSEVVQREEIQRFAWKGLWFVWLRLLNQLVETSLQECELRTNSSKRISISEVMDADKVGHRLDALITYVHDEHLRRRFEVWRRFLRGRSRAQEEAEYVTELVSPSRERIPLAHVALATPCQHQSALQNLSPIEAPADKTQKSFIQRQELQQPSSSGSYSPMRSQRLQLDSDHQHELSVGDSFVMVAVDALQTDLIQSHREYLCLCAEKEEDFLRRQLVKSQLSDRAFELSRFLFEGSYAWFPQFAKLMSLQFAIAALHESESRLRMEIAVTEGCSVVDVVLDLRIFQHEVRQRTAPKRLSLHVRDSHLWENSARIAQRSIRAYGARRSVSRLRHLLVADSANRVMLLNDFSSAIIELSVELNRRIERIHAALTFQRLGRGASVRRQLSRCRPELGSATEEHLASNPSLRVTAQHLVEGAVSDAQVIITKPIVNCVQSVGRGYHCRKQLSQQLVFWRVDEKARSACLHVAIGILNGKLKLTELEERENVLRRAVESQWQQSKGVCVDEYVRRSRIIADEHETFAAILGQISFCSSEVILNASEALDRLHISNACDLDTASVALHLFWVSRAQIDGAEAIRRRRLLEFLEGLGRQALGEQWWYTFDSLTSVADAGDNDDENSQDTIDSNDDVRDDVASTLSEKSDADSGETISSDLGEEGEIDGQSRREQQADTHSFASDVNQQDEAIRSAIMCDENLRFETMTSEFLELIRISRSIARLAPTLYQDVSGSEEFDRSVVIDAHNMLMIFYLESVEVERRRIFLFGMTHIMAQFQVVKLELLRRCEIEKLMREEWDAVFGHDDADIDDDDGGSSDENEDFSESLASEDDIGAASPKSNASGVTRAHAEDDDQSSGIDDDSSTGSDFTIESGASSTPRPQLAKAAPLKRNELDTYASLALRREELQDRNQILIDYLGKAAKFVVAQEYFCRHANVLSEATGFFTRAMARFQQLTERAQVEQVAGRARNKASAPTAQRPRTSISESASTPGFPLAANYMSQLQRAKNARWV